MHGVDEAGKRYSNRDVAEELATVADMLQILNANRFRVIAFQTRRRRCAR